MIESKEDYERYKACMTILENYPGQDTVFSSMDETFQLLRTVARAADGFLDVLDTDGGNAYLPDNIDLGLMRRALDAVPGWVLDSEE